MGGNTPIIKEPWEVDVMREAGRITHSSMMAAARAVRAGISTGELDDIARASIEKQGAVGTFIGYKVGGKPPYRHATCISVNEEIVHGIPDRKRVLKEGDIVSIDIGATHKGYVGDCACTIAVGRVTERAQRIIDVTRESLAEAIKVMKPGARLSHIGIAVQGYAQERGFSVVRDYCGHGVGRDLHEAPQVPNYFDPKFLDRDILLKPGHVLAIEPMLCEGTHETRELSDRWTVVTADGKLSAHWEHTIAITKDGCDILTRSE